MEVRNTGAVDIEIMDITARDIGVMVKGIRHHDRSGDRGGYSYNSPHN
jgi:tRNA A58 N-methylase Trm61